MYRELNLKSALQAYIEGEDVGVILPMEDLEDRLVPIERMFYNARFLVDKKVARPNPEWEAAVQDMVDGNAEKIAADTGENAAVSQQEKAAESNLGGIDGRTQEGRYRKTHGAEKSRLEPEEYRG